MNVTNLIATSIINSYSITYDIHQYSKPVLFLLINIRVCQYLYGIFCCKMCYEMYLKLYKILLEIRNFPC